MSSSQIFLIIAIAAALAYIVFIVGFGWQARSRWSRQLLALVAAAICVVAPLLLMRSGIVDPTTLLARSGMVAAAGLSAVALLALLTARSRYDLDAADVAATPNLAIDVDDEQLAPQDQPLADTFASSNADAALDDAPDAAQLPVDETQTLYTELRDRADEQVDEQFDFPDDAPWLDNVEGKVDLDDIAVNDGLASAMVDAKNDGLHTNTAPATLLSGEDHLLADEPKIDISVEDAEWQEDAIDPASIAGGSPVSEELPPGVTSREALVASSSLAVTAREANAQAQIQRTERLVETERGARLSAEAQVEIERSARLSAESQVSEQHSLIVKLRTDLSHLQQHVTGLQAEKRSLQARAVHLSATARDAAKLARSAADARRKAEIGKETERQARITQEGATDRAVEVARNAIAALSAAERKTGIR